MFHSFISFCADFLHYSGGMGALFFIAAVTFCIGFFFALFRFIKSFNIFN